MKKKVILAMAVLMVAGSAMAGRVSLWAVKPAPVPASTVTVNGN